MKLHIHGREGVGELDAQDGERILYCGLRHGIKLPYECGIGKCGTCSAVLLSGKVRSLWTEAPGYGRVRSERNEILMCQSVMESDVHLKVRPAVKPPVPLPVANVLEGEIANQKPLNELVVSFDYRLSRPIAFNAGQFVAVSTKSVPGFRAYSMTNFTDSPTDCLSFVVKDIPGGDFTDWLFDKSRNGEPLAGFGPLGRAVFSSEIDGDFIVMAGGTGIAGIMSILANASLHGHFDRYKAQVVFGLNRIEDVFYLEILNSYCATHPTLRVLVTLVDCGGVDSLRSRFPELDFARGFLHQAGADWLEELTEVSVAFLAGPPPAVEASLQLLVRERKFSARKIRFDKFA
ncbi:MAG: 2Fe-2S iron-sulfur cluster binding domain-containing protein [Acidiferrobacterales bacterium]|nr:2Fe-2S iron-sulfur cluster binding domain-containing protein [Acidiferrobacterales bacterium]